MDPLSVISLTTTLLTLGGVTLYVGHALYRTVVAVKDASPDMHRLEEELGILSDVLYESTNTVNMSAHVSKDVLRSVDLCKRRYGDVVQLIRNDLLATKGGRPLKSLIARMRWVYLEKERSRTYNSFRDAALMLRDLVSDIRIEEQFVNIGITMATIMDEDDQWNGTSEADHRQQVDDYYRARPAAAGAAPRMKGRSQIMRQMIRNDWISDVWVMVDVGKSEAARELKDTGSDFNFISYIFLITAGADLTKMKPSPTESIQGIVQGVTFKPSHQIELSYVRERGRMMHKSTFFIVGHPDDVGEGSNLPDFDIIVSKAETARYIRQGRSALIAASRKKTDAELKAEQDARAKKEEEEAEIERRRLEEAAKAKAEAKAKAAATT